VTTEANWDSKNKLFVHVYYNPVMASLAKSELYSEVKQLENNAKLEPESKGKLIQYMKYLNIICINKKASEYAINIKQEILDKELLYSGWLVIISNHVDNAAEALYIYRAKDVVEKGFSKLKNNLELNRLRVHSSDSMQNKVFVSFIALIIMSHIHTIMLENDFYSKMSMKKLIHILEKLKTHYIKGERILYPITKEQKTIYKAFGLREPQ
jgi:transposase